jgi:hypothetical protein
MYTWRKPFRAWEQMNDVAKACLAVAAGAFLIAGLGAVVNLFFKNWFQSVGMAMVGLFYLVLFLANYPPRGVTALGAAEWMKPMYTEHKGAEAEEEHLCP